MNRSKRERAAILAAVLALSGAPGCFQGGGGEPGPAADGRVRPATDEPVPDAEVPPPPNEPIAPEHLVLAFRDGQATEMDDRAARQEGLTVLSLRDDWAPRCIAGTPELPSTYERVFVDLANERGEPTEQMSPEAAGYFLEVYGIPPSLSVLKRRLAVDEARPCLRDIDYASLANFRGFLAYNGARSDLGARAARFRALERTIERLMREQGVDRPEEITGDQHRENVARYLAEAPTRHALRAAQKRLECEELYPGNGRHTADVFDWQTHMALLNFERRSRLYGWGYINEETARALSWPPREYAYQGFRRVLSERIASDVGVLEDGSTFRDGEPPRYVGRDGAEHPLRNLVDELTDAAMRQLGLETPDDVAEFLGSHDFSSLRVAVRLPELPEYYSGHMDLQVVIDRGDVWYDYPFDVEGNEVPQPVSRRPTLTVYTTYLEKQIPLVRYGTTIGGWRSELIDGVEYWSYKNSDVGDRVWREIIGGPVWIPPDTTPTRDLVIKRRRGGTVRYEVDYAETGPSYNSAYGMVMAINVRPAKRSDGTVAYIDNGIRVHGSGSYMSIQRRHSHGCHRLHNHLAVRLFSFVLGHRHNTRQGQQPIVYSRTFEHEGQELTIELRTRGYFFALDPPMPLTVTEGRVRGERRTPHTEPIIKPEEAERLRLEQEAAQTAGVPGEGPPQFLPPPEF